MTAILQQPAGSGSGSTADARNLRGTVSGLAPSATTTLVTTSAGTRKLRGFSVHGTTDGEAWIEIDGTPMYGIKARFSRVLAAYLALPNPEVPPGSGSTITLRVENTGTVAGDYEGTLFAE